MGSPPRVRRVAAAKSGLRGIEEIYNDTDREVTRFLDILDDAFAGTTTNLERLETYIRLQFEDFATRPPPPGRELAAVLAPDVYERFLGHIQPVERVVRDLVADGVAAGEFLDLDHDATALLIIGCIGAERVPLGTGRHDADQAVERVTGFLARALGAEAALARTPARDQDHE